jgi:hypothetical protein
LTAGIVLAVSTLTGDGPTAYLFYAFAGTALIWIFHKDNIERLLKGQERKLEFRRHEPSDGGDGAGVGAGSGGGPDAAPDSSPDGG